MDLRLFITPKVVGQSEIMNNDQNSNLKKMDLRPLYLDGAIYKPLLPLVNFLFKSIFSPIS